MKSRAAAVFAGAAAVHLGGTMLAALWPLCVQLHGLPTPRQLASSYRVSSSAVDVMLLALLQVLLSSVLLLMAKPPREGRRSTHHRRWEGSQPRGWLALALPPGKALLGVRLIGPVFQLLLLSKAVAVAVLGGSNPWPGTRLGDYGAVLPLAAVALACLCGFVEHYSAKALLGRWQHIEEGREEEEEGGGGGEGRDSSKEPLLGRAAGGEGDHTGGEEGKSHEAGKERSDKKKKKKEKSSATIMALIKLSSPDWAIISIAFAAGTAGALAQASIPYYTGHIIDAASRAHPSVPEFHLLTEKLVLAAFVCAIFTGVRGGLFTVAMTRLNVRLRERLFKSLLRQEIGFYDLTKTGDVTSRLAADTTTVSDQIALNINVMMRSLTQAAMVLVFMFSTSWRLTIVTFVLVPLIVGVCKVYGRYYRKLSKRVQTALAEANSVAEEALSSMTTVRAHAAEAGVASFYSARLAAFYSLQQREAAAYAAYAATNTFLPNTVSAAVLFYGGSLVLGGDMSAGALVSFMLYQQSLLSAFQNVGDVFSALTAAVGAADKVMELMHREPKVPHDDGQLAPAVFKGRLALKDVVFRYPARPNARVLSGLSLEVQPGEVVALVGPSGGGKSSIVKLLERFYVPEAGQVLIDGRDIGEYRRTWLRRRLAIVSQEPVLYARSVRRNICLGLEEEDGVPPEERPTQEEVEDAARLANAHEFISSWPDGYDTECGEKGVQLSGGQKQRIAIARALVRKPAVLLLDEATSALDADSEAVVQEALDRTMRDRTVLVIAHRLSTIQDADRIVVVHHGVVKESGSHDELLEAGGTYSSLVRRQMYRSQSAASLAGAAGGGGLIRPVSSLSLASTSSYRPPQQQQQQPPG